MFERIVRQMLAVVVCVSLVSSQSMGGWDVGILRAAKKAGGNKPETADSPAPNNTPPKISKIADRIIAINGVATATFLVSDAETPAGALRVTATSDNPDFLPNDRLSVTTEESRQILNASPTSGKEGAATITVTVTDGGGLKTSTNFLLTSKVDLPYVPGEIIVTYKTGVTPGSLVPMPTSPGAVKGPSAQKAGVGLPTVRPLLRNPIRAVAQRSFAHSLGQRSPRISLGGEELAAKSLENLQRTYVLTFDDTQDVQNIKEALERDPGVEKVQSNQIFKINSVDDPFYVGGDLWGLKKVHAQEAWDHSAKGEGVVVAVLDTGIDATHPDLAPNIWTNLNEISGNGIDDDVNGYVDDVNGWNFVGNNNGPVDGNGHGTHVSGTIAAVGENGGGVVGLAYKAKIMPLKGLSDEGTGTLVDLVNGLRYAADNGADVINNSWGGILDCGETSVINQAVNYAYGKGVTVVAGAGNDNMDVAQTTPAGCENVISVTATDSSDKKAPFSNWGAKIDVASPGVGILSTIPDNKYAKLSGTSMACPHVAGLAALILSRFPDYTNAQVRGLIRSSADDFGTPGNDPQFGYGRINGAKAFGVVPVSLLTVNSSPDGARIWYSVDGGVLTDSGKETNHTFTGLPAGSYKVTVVKEGYTEWTETQRLPEGGNIVFDASLTNINDNDPHATGALPPTEEELAWQRANMIVPQQIKLNALGLSRVNQYRVAKGMGTLALPATEIVALGQEVVGVTQDQMTVQGSSIEPMGPPAIFPMSVDNSELKFFPPIRSQGQLGSCAQFAGIYYCFTHMNALARDLDAKTGGENVLFSPKFTYNVANHGLNGGSSIIGGWRFVSTHGVATWADWPYDEDFKEWPRTASVWRNALNAGIVRTGKISACHTERGMEQMKTLLVNGFVLTFGTYGYAWKFKSISNDPSTSEDDEFAESGKEAAYLVFTRIGGHAMTVVGYNDSIWVDINENGVVDQGEKGALRIANSWGTDWKDGGYTWLAYDALKPVTGVTGWPSSTVREAAFFAQEAYWVTAKTDYTPKALAQFTLNHGRRDELDISLGISDTTDMSPTTVWIPDVALLHNNQGGSFAFDGGETAVDGTFVMDLTSIAPAPDSTKRWYLKIIDNSIGNQTILKEFKWINGTNDAEVVKTQLPINIDNDFSISFVDAALSPLNSQDNDLPSRPGTLVLDQILQDAMTLAWDASTDNVGVAGYLLDLSTEKGFDFFVAGYHDLDVGNVLSRSITGLIPSTTYYARLRAYDGAGNLSLPSTAGSAVTQRDTQAPTAPTSPYLTPVLSKELQLTWDASTDNAGVTGYALDVSTNEGFNSFVAGYENLEVGNVRSKSISGLTPSSLFYARVRARDRAGNISLNSPTVWATTKDPDTQAPLAPSKPTFSTVSPAELHLVWDVPTDNVGVTGYVLDVSTEETFGTFVPGYEKLEVGNVISRSLTGLNPATTYYARVRARDGEGNESINSPVEWATTEADGQAPTGPTSPYLRVISATELEFTWGASTDNGEVAGYTMDLSTDERFGTFVAEYENLNVMSALSRSIPGLQPTTTYYVRVRAYDGAGNVSEPSPQTSAVTPLDLLAPTAPSDLSLSVVSPTEMSLTWSPATDNVGVTGYSLDLSTDINFGSFVLGYENLDVGNVTTWSITGASPSVFARLRAHDNAGNVSEPSSLTMVKPIAPIILSVQGPNTKVLNLFWKVPSDDPLIADYFIDVSTEQTFATFVPGKQNLNVGHVFKFKIEDLTDNTTYFVRIKARNKTGDFSEFSDVIFGKTPLDKTAPGQPQNGTLEAQSLTEMVVTWNPAYDDTRVTGYRLDLSTDNDFGSYVPGYENLEMGNVTSQSLTGLTSTANIFARVRAYDRAGNISPSSAPFRVKPRYPVLRVYEVSLTTIGIAWLISVDDTWIQDYSTDVSLDREFKTFLPGRENLNIGYVDRYKIDGLNPGTKYYVRARARDKSGNYSDYSVSVYPMLELDTRAPKRPNIPSLSTNSATVLNVAWTATTDNVGVTGYFLDLSTSSTFESYVEGYENLDVGNVTNRTITGVMSSTTFYVRLRARDGSGNISEHSETVSITTPELDTEAPTAPSGLTLLVTSQTELRLTWAAATDNVGIGGYYLDLSMDEGFGSFVAGYENLDVGNAKSRTITGMTPLATMYYARLRAYDRAGNLSGNSNIVPLKPRAPQLRLSATGTTLVDVSWTDPNVSSLVADYSMDVALENSFTDFVPGKKDINVELTTTYRIGGLSPSTTYYVRVKARDQRGIYSDFSNFREFRTYADTRAPNQPAVPSLSAVSATVLNVTWTASTDDVGVTGYSLDLSTSGTFGSYVEGYENLDVGNVTNRLVSGLMPFTLYYARLRARDNAGNVSQPSSPRSGRTLADTLSPTVPSALQLSAVSATTLSLMWETSTDDVGVTGYRLDVSANEGFESFIPGYENLDVGNVLHRSIPGLIPATTYYVRLRAVDYFGNVSTSATAYATTPELDIEAPSVPDGLSLLETNTLSNIKLSWSAATDNLGVTGYSFDLSTDENFGSYVAGYENLDVGNATSRMIAGMTPLTTKYYARLRAYDRNGNVSGNSDIVPLKPKAPKMAPSVTATFNALSVSWSHETNIEMRANYSLEVSTDEEFTTFVPGKENINVKQFQSYTINGLNSGTTYYIRVKAQDILGTWSDYSNTLSWQTKTDLIAPSQPTLSGLVAVSATELNLTWSAATDNVEVTGYSLDLSTDENFGSFVAGYENLDVGNATSRTITGMTPLATTYYARLRAYDRAGNLSGNSNIVPLKPRAPQLRLSATGTTLVDVSWTDPNVSSLVADYSMDVALENSFTDFVPGKKDINVGLTTTYRIGDLAPSTTYYVRVRVRDQKGIYSDFSNVSRFRTYADTLPPSRPAVPSLSAVSATVLNVTWTASTDDVGVTGYSLDLSTSGTFGSYVEGYKNLDVGNVTNRLVSGLMPFTHYYARLRARDNAGNVSQPSSPRSGRTLADTLSPTVPSALQLSAVSATTLSLMWETSTDDVGVTGYRLDVSTNEGFESFVVGYENLDVWNVLVKSLTGLNPSTRFYARLRAYDLAGNVSQNSEIAQATTLEPPDTEPPTPPSNVQLQMLAPTRNAVYLTWKASSDNVGVKGYRMDLSTTENFSSMVQGYGDYDVGTGLTRNIEGLESGPTYYVRLRAYDVAGNVSTNSNVGMSTTWFPDTTPPTVPTNLKLLATSATEMELTWSGSKDDRGWFWYYVDVSTDPNFTTFVKGYQRFYMEDWRAETPKITIAGLSPLTRYYARVMAMDPPGNASAYSSTVSSSTGEDFVTSMESSAAWAEDGTIEMRGKTNFSSGGVSTWASVETVDGVVRTESDTVSPTGGSEHAVVMTKRNFPTARSEARWKTVVLSSTIKKDRTVITHGKTTYLNEDDATWDTVETPEGKVQTEAEIVTPKGERETMRSLSIKTKKGVETEGKSDYSNGDASTWVSLETPDGTVKTEADTFTLKGERTQSIVETKTPYRFGRGMDGRRLAMGGQ